jgi:flagellar biosynthesis/type III secretory pathway protein FliH
MNREELKDALKKAYEQGYHNGYADACDAVALASTETITSVVTKLKEVAQKAEAEIIDDLEEDE